MKIDMKMILFIVAGLMVFSAFNTVPKQAVADVEGFACTTDADCPCWGELSDGTPSYGVGASSCVTCEEGDERSACTKNSSPTGAKVCDVTYCMDTQEVGMWLRDHPWNWLKTNPLYTFAIIAVLITAFLLPKGR